MNKIPYLVIPWSDDEIASIKLHYSEPNGRRFLLENLNGRSEGSIDKMAIRLGLKSFRIWLRENLTVESILKNSTKDDKTGCIIWNGSGPKGYAGIYIGKHIYVHRLVYMLAHPSESLDGLGVLHKCDNPPCVNLEHLYAGTQAQNMLDITVRGRRKWSLTEKDIPVIRDRLAKGNTLLDIADDYDVAFTTISAIKRGITWTHVL